MIRRKIIGYVPTPACIERLNARIQELEDKIEYYHPEGVEITVSPQTAYVGRAKTITINVTTTLPASIIKLYRNNVEIHQEEGKSGFSYQDEDFTPQTTDAIVYKAEAVIDGKTKSNHADVTVKNDVLTRITWTGSINPSTIEPEATATLDRGSVTAYYESGVSEVVTDGIEYIVSGGTLEGNTYTAPADAGTYSITAKYGGKTASITVIVIDTFLTVQYGSGADYNSTTFADTNQKLTDNMVITFHTNEGDYLFIKVDKRDTVRNLYTDSGVGLDYAIPLDSGTIVDDYKYYKSTIRVRAGEITCKINKTI